MTPALRLKEIEERLEGVTPGPWKYDYGNWEIETDNGKRVTLSKNPPHGEIGGEHDDANFMANARMDVPWLLSRVKQLEAALEFYASGKSLTIPTIKPDCDDIAQWDNSQFPVKILETILFSVCTTAKEALTTMPEEK